MCILNGTQNIMRMFLNKILTLQRVDVNEILLILQI